MLATFSDLEVSTIRRTVGSAVADGDVARAIELGESLAIRGQASPETLLNLAKAHTGAGTLRVAAAHLRQALECADSSRDAAVIAEGCHWASSELMPRMRAAGLVR